MKNVLMVLAVLAVAAPALAGDGQVSQSDLASVGLGQMSVMSDVQGMQVRGMSSNSQSTGLLLVSGLLFDPITGSDTRGSLALFSRGTAENAGLSPASDSGASIDDGAGGLAGLQGNLVTVVGINPAFTGSFAVAGIGVTVGFGQ